MTTALMVIAAVLALAAFGALYWWTRKSERDIGYDKPGLSEEQANALRFGIAVSSSQTIGGPR
jgi:flagellar basal body-associated protein FliL